MINLILSVLYSVCTFTVQYSTEFKSSGHEQIDEYCSELFTAPNKDISTNVYRACMLMDDIDMGEL